MKTLNTLLLASLLALSSLSSAHAADQATPVADMTEGEIKKVDKDNKKLTIKHGEIKNLDMPSMTMVFKLKDPALVDKVKVGDKIRFVVENTAAGMVVTELVPADK